MAKPAKPLLLRVMVEVDHKPPTATQLAAWDRAWKLLSAMPAPTEAKPAPVEAAGEAATETKGHGGG